MLLFTFYSYGKEKKPDFQYKIRYFQRAQTPHIVRYKRTGFIRKIGILFSPKLFCNKGVFGEKSLDN